MSIRIFRKIKELIYYILFGDDLKSTILFITILFLVYIIIKLTNPFLFSVVLTNSMQHTNFYPEKYLKYNITVDEISKWPYKNGINPGDLVIILPAHKLSDIKEGDVVLYIGVDGRPIMHRVIKIYNSTCIVVMGDNNPEPIYYQHENCLNLSRIYGKVVFRIPYLGYPRFLLSKLL